MPSARVSPLSEPMYATVGPEVPTGDGWTFEPKFDGMRVLAHVSSRGVRLVTRNGKEKQAQFPEIVARLLQVGERIGQPVVLDGEVVALDAGAAGSFQALQQRMHLRERDRVNELAREAPAALFVFDLLQLGGDPLVTLPWSVRRRALERLLGRGAGRGAVRLAESVADADEMLARARRGRWEGVIAKRADAPYVPGARSRDWLKLKLEYRAEFVVGGFTEPRNSREHIGALLLGYFDDGGDLRYAGHTGGGFDRAGLQRMHERLAPLERATSPFTEVPRTNERAHWVQPKVVVEVRFAEWTSDGRLRQPIYLGTRDDKAARDVKRESTSIQEWRMPAGATARGGRSKKTDATTKATASRARARKAPGKTAMPKSAPKKAAAKAAAKKVPARKPAAKKAPARKPAAKKAPSGKPASKPPAVATEPAKKSAVRNPAPLRKPAPTGRAAGGSAAGAVFDQLLAIEKDGGDGDVLLETGKSLHVSSLDKPYFPDAGLTKGDVMRYYVSVAPPLLDFLQDRPLALSRYPEGIAGHTFYQQNALKGAPEGVRVEEVAVAGGDEAERFVGADLMSLLYLVQMGTIVIHAWFSRMPALDEPDLSLIDLDPGEGVTFGDVVALARVVRKVTDALGLGSVVKTSGSRGMHIGIPLPAGASYEDSAALARRVAEDALQARPDLATLERRIADRPKGSILVDVNQNARGKTMVAPYALRARPGATVSAPVEWKEVGARLAMDRFTARTMPRRLDRSGDPWAVRLRRRNSADAVARALEKR